MAVQLPDGRPLIGAAVRLDPVAVTDAEGLFAALDDPLVYAAGFGGGPAGRPSAVSDMVASLAAAVTDGRRVASYTVRLLADGPAGPAGTIVGTSSLGDVVVSAERIHLGWTAWPTGRSGTPWCSRSCGTSGQVCETACWAGCALPETFWS